MSEEGQCNRQGTHTSESRGSVVEVLPGQPAQCACRLAVLNFVGGLRRINLETRWAAPGGSSTLKTEFAPGAQSYHVHEAAKGAGTQHS